VNFLQRLVGVKHVALEIAEGVSVAEFDVQGVERVIDRMGVCGGR
jgi:hypothetical protein